MISSGHLDGFTRDHLPDIRLWPHLQYVLPELQYPDRLNCSTRLLDRHIECGAGERRCIVAPGTLWSYRDLYERANRIAHVLTEDLGVVSGNRVLLRGFNSPMLAAAWFAVMKIGAVAVTAMPLYRAGELRYMIDKAQVSHALCDDRLAEDLQTATKDAAQFERVLWGGEGSDSLEHRMSSKSPSFQSADTAADDVAIIGFTSGTTGRPKAAMHFHRDILSTCDTFGKRVLAPSANDLFCGSPPLGFTFGLGGLLLFPLDAGAATVLIEKAQAEPLLSAIEEFGVTVLFTAPVAYRAMGELVHARNLRSLRTCVSAGETLPPSVWNLWYDRTGLKIVDGIGSTEMLHIFIGSPENEAMAGSTGRAVPGYVAEIHDEAGTPLPSGSVGRLAVRGPTGCKYLDDIRQETYVQNGWNYPGDAYLRDSSGYFWYVARADDMIISSGYNISGPEVEQALLAHESVADCAVVAKPDAARETNIVKAYVVLKKGCDDGEGTIAALQAFVKAHIAAYKCPREIEFVRELPRTETGKVQRYRLREKAKIE